MSRDWCAIYAAMLGKPKYRRLSLPARAALFHVWLIAGAQTPEATWTNREDLVDVLDLDGYPGDVLDELLSRRWLDLDPDGRILVHDWDDHQLAATEAIRRAYERDRKQEWRRSRAPLSPDPSLPVQNTTGLHDITGQDSTESPIVPERPGQVRDSLPPVQPQPTNGRPGHTRPAAEVEDAFSPDRTTCPSCGDGPLDDKETNVARDRGGQLWHRSCPAVVAVSA